MWTVHIDAYAEGQIGIHAVDEHGVGHGYRIAGPKFTGNERRTTKRVLTARDVAEIRRYLDLVEAAS